MDINSLPTDNLYKFITIFSIALVLSCAYASVSVYNSQLQTFKELREQEINLQEKKEKDEVILKKLEYVQEEMVRTNSDKKLYLKVILTTFFLSIITTFVGFICWYFNLQRYLDKKIKIEISNLEKRITENQESQQPG